MSFGDWKLFFQKTIVYSDPAFEIICKDMTGGDVPETIRFIVNNYIRMFLLPKYITENYDTSNVSPSAEFFEGFFDTYNNRDCFLKAIACEYENKAIIGIKDMIDKYLRFYGLKKG